MTEVVPIPAGEPETRRRPRRHHRATALSLAVVTFLAGIGVALLFLRYLEPSRERSLFAAWAAGGAGAAALIVHETILRLPDRRGYRWAAWLLAAAVFAAPLPTSWTLRSIPYARFGLTVYGVVPVPALDITVDARGRLGIRSKSHLITREEVETLLAPGVEVLVIGDGWNRRAKLDPAVFDLLDRVEIIVLPTPDAFATFESLSRERRGRVVLLAHTTC